MFMQEQKIGYGLCVPVENGTGSDIFETEKGKFKVLSTFKKLSQAQEFAVMKAGQCVASLDLSNQQVRFIAWQ